LSVSFFEPLGTNGAKETHSIWANAIVQKGNKEEESKEEREKKVKVMKQIIEREARNLEELNVAKIASCNKCG